MSLALIHSRALLGLQAPAVTVEVHLANGLPSFTLVGLADTEVKEARERVRVVWRSCRGRVSLRLVRTGRSIHVKLLLSIRSMCPLCARAS
jgi:hypothetical protein